MSDFDKQNGNEPKILRLPEEHPELVVRVAGYSAYFTRLPESIQDEVIERTSQEL